jgi:hypothetical protein
VLRMGQACPRLTYYAFAAGLSQSWRYGRGAERLTNG